MSQYSHQSKPTNLYLHTYLYVVPPLAVTALPLGESVPVDAAPAPGEQVCYGADTSSVCVCLCVCRGCRVRMRLKSEGGIVG